MTGSLNGSTFTTDPAKTRSYYAVAGMIIAVKVGTALQYLLTDHLGSVVATTDSAGTLTSQQRYLPFGGARTIAGSPLITATDFTYTGQRNLPDTGLMDYKARFYSPALGRFIQPDTVIPEQANPQSWNRFSYVHNTPTGYTDPTGHMRINEDGSSKNGCSDAHYCKDGKPDDSLKKEKGGGDKPLNSPTQNDPGTLCDTYHQGDKSCVDGILNEEQTNLLAGELTQQANKANEISNALYWGGIAAVVTAGLLTGAFVVLATGGLAAVPILGWLSLEVAATSITAGGILAAGAGVLTATSVASGYFDHKSSQLSTAASALTTNSNGNMQVAAYNGHRVQVQGTGMNDVLIPSSGYDSVLKALGR